MRAALFQPDPDKRRTPLRERVTASGLAIAIEILIAIAVIYALTPYRLPPIIVDSNPKSFTMSDTSDKQAATRTKSPRAAKEKKAAASAAPKVTHAPIPNVTPVKGAPKPFQLAGLLPIDLDKADISKIHNGDAASPDAGDASGKDTGSSYGPGAGPGGERLYNVAWYREPTHAELAGYLPNGAPAGGWADIACKMIADYHVENCRPLGESPIGSGLSRAMRQAAWQFLVRPPRVGDRVMLGTWVRIHIEFNGPAKDDK